MNLLDLKAEVRSFFLNRILMTDDAVNGVAEFAMLVAQQAYKQGENSTRTKLEGLCRDHQAKINDAITAERHKICERIYKFQLKHDPRDLHTPAVRDLVFNTMQPKEWCKHCRPIGGGYYGIFVDGQYKWHVPKDWGQCPIEGCGTKRPKEEV